MRPAFRTIVLIVSGVLLGGPAAAQKLDKVRQEVREPQAGDTEDSGREDQTPYWGDGRDVDDYQQPAYTGDSSYAEENQAAEILLGYCLGFAFWPPHVFMEGEDPRPGWFPGHPYRDGHKGYMVLAEKKPAVLQVETTAEGDLLIGQGDELITEQPVHTHPIAVRLAAEYSHDLETVYKPWAQIMLSTHWRFGLESGWTWLREDLGDGWDQLFIGDLNMIFRFAQHEHGLMRSGIGGRTMIDSGQADWGANWTYGFDVFPVRPIIFSASIDLGNLGYAFFLHGRGQLGLTPGVVEIYGGWDVMLIGQVVFHGPVIGLRAWL